MYKLTLDVVRNHDLAWKSKGTRRNTHKGLWPLV